MGIVLDAAGRAPVSGLLAGCARAGTTLTREELDEVVATNDKTRFESSADGLRICDSQGHTVEVEVGYQPARPPEFL